MRTGLFVALLLLATGGIGFWIVSMVAYRVGRRRLEVEVRERVPTNPFAGSSSRPALPGPADGPRSVEDAPYSKLRNSDELRDLRKRKRLAHLAVGPLIVGILAGLGALVIGPPSEERRIAGTASATTVLFETFEERLEGRWSTTKVGTTSSGRRFLGRFSEETVDLIVDDLPPHRSIEISFDLFIVGSWDGLVPRPGYGPDHFQVRADRSDPIFDATFTNSGPESITRQSYPLQYGTGNCPGESGASETDTLGYLFRGTVHDSVYRISTNVDHDASDVRIRFSGFGLTRPSDDPLRDESWGLDNVTITTSTQTEPDPVPRWATSCEV